MYQGQYFTIISGISKCDHKCETRNAEPEIGTDGSRQTRRNLRVDGYGSGFGPPSVCRSGFWTVLELNRPVFAVQTRTAGALPGPVANSSQSLAVGLRLIRQGNLWLRGRSVPVEVAAPRRSLNHPCGQL